MKGYPQQIQDMLDSSPRLIEAWFDPDFGDRQLELEAPGVGSPQFLFQCRKGQGRDQWHLTYITTYGNPQAVKGDLITDAWGFPIEDPKLLAQLEGWWMKARTQLRWRGHRGTAYGY